MSVIIRLQGLSWSASAADIRNFFNGLSIPPGGVRIIGGEKGDAFIAFSTDEDARQAMMMTSKMLNELPVQLFLSSKTEMQNTILQAKNAAESQPMEQQIPQQQMQTPGQQTGMMGLPQGQQLLPGLGPSTATAPNTPPVSNIPINQSTLASLSQLSGLLPSNITQALGFLANANLIPTTTSNAAQNNAAPNMPVNAYPGSYQFDRNINSGQPLNAVNTQGNFNNSSSWNQNYSQDPRAMQAAPLQNNFQGWGPNNQTGVQFHQPSDVHDKSGSFSGPRLTSQMNTPNESLDVNKTKTLSDYVDEFGRNKPIDKVRSEKDDRRDSKERDRSRDRSRERSRSTRDSPRDKDRDKRDRDRDRKGDSKRRDPRSSSRRERERGRDRDDDNPRRGSDADKESDSESGRRAKKRSLSPSSKDSKEKDKKLQTSRPGDLNAQPPGTEAVNFKQHSQQNVIQGPLVLSLPSSVPGQPSLSATHPLFPVTSHPPDRRHIAHGDHRAPPALSSSQPLLIPSNTSMPPAQNLHAEHMNTFPMQRAPGGPPVRPNGRGFSPAPGQRSGLPPNEPGFGLRDEIGPPREGIGNQIPPSDRPPFGRGRGERKALLPNPDGPGIAPNTPLTERQDLRRPPGPMDGQNFGRPGFRGSNDGQPPFDEMFAQNMDRGEPRFGPDTSRPPPNSNDGPLWNANSRGNFRGPPDAIGLDGGPVDRFLMDRAPIDVDVDERGPPRDLNRPPFNGPLEERPYSGTPGRGRGERPRFETPFSGGGGPRFAGSRAGYDISRGRGTFNGPPGRFEGPRSRFLGPTEKELRFDDRPMDGPLERIDGPPGRFDRPPERFDGPPDRLDGPPVRFAQPVGRFNGPPERLDGPPGRFDLSGRPDLFDGPPGRMDGPPGRMDAPPGRMDGPPGRMDGLPGRMDGPPGRMDGPPGRMDGPPGRMDGPSGRMDGPPGRMDGPSGRMDGPSVRMDGPPGRMDGPLGRMDGTRGLIDGPPGRINGPRGFMDVPRGLMDGPPGRIDGPPGRMDRPPGLMDGQPGRMDDRDIFEQLPDRFEGSRDRFNGPPLRFDGPPDRFDGPADRFDGPPNRFEGPPDRLDGPRDRFDGPRDRFDGPRDRFDGPLDRDMHRVGRFDRSGPPPEGFNRMPMDHDERIMGPAEMDDPRSRRGDDRLRSFDEFTDRDDRGLDGPMSQDDGRRFTRDSDVPRVERFDDGRHGRPDERRTGARPREDRRPEEESGVRFRDDKRPEGESDRRRSDRRPDEGHSRTSRRSPDKRSSDLTGRFSDRRGSGRDRSDKSDKNDSRKNRDRSDVRDSKDGKRSETSAKREEKSREESKASDSAKTDSKDKSSSNSKSNSSDSQKNSKETQINSNVTHQNTNAIQKNLSDTQKNSNDTQKNSKDIPKSESVKTPADPKPLITSTAADAKGKSVDNTLKQDSSGKPGDAPCCIMLSSIAHETSYKDIRRFFNSSEIPPKNGIKILNDENGKRIGKAYVSFANDQSFKNALKQDRLRLRNIPVVITPVTRKEFAEAVDSFVPVEDYDRAKEIDMCNTMAATLRTLKGDSDAKGPKPGNEFVLRLSKLPENTTADTVKKFFSGLQISKGGEAVFLESDRKKTCTGVCLVEFETEEALKLGLKRKIFNGISITSEQTDKKAIEALISKMKKELEAETENKNGNATAVAKETSLVSVQTKDISVPPDMIFLRLKNIVGLKHWDIRPIFDGLGVKIINVQVAHDAVGKPLGEAYVEFDTSSSVKKALRRNNIFCKGQKIVMDFMTRAQAIENLRICKQALKPESPTRSDVFFYVKASNLPKNVTTGELMAFLSGFQPAPESIRLNIGEGNQPPDASTALIGFRIREDAEAAVVAKDQEMLRGKAVTLAKIIL
ncbi:uncharacterized protein LOC127845363 isoform X2 [Dreissena polymorpha]|uniref:uncharacterized protein LOC127845363 isoform X2 n=1 Tax=Dreissena polymorpha TaxID=45954 RepID=UPI0022646AA6|nr:uncharacterized protein LOC127845363 isoform X2 [Dreissena polymorpha]